MIVNRDAELLELIEKYTNKCRKCYLSIYGCGHACDEHLEAFEKEWKEVSHKAKAMSK